MKIKRIIGATIEEIKDKKFNIWIGISLGNRYFTKSRIKAYILWALGYTKKDIVIVIADSLHIVNFEILKNYSKEIARERAEKVGKDIKNSVQRIVYSLSKEDQKRLRILNWKEATNFKTYKEAERIVFNLFKNDSEFRKRILQVVRKQLGKHAPEDNKKIERLAEYVLKELPILILGVENKGKLYNLIPYPGLTELDILVEEINSKNIFPEIIENIEPKQKRVIVEAYADT